jgi:hypothetical protein
MAKDAISKRLANMVSYVWEAREQLDGDVVAMLEQADIEPRDSTFELFGLDPKKSLDHRVLLYLLDNIIFGKGRVGAPKKWSDWGARPGQYQLKTDILTVNRKSKKSVREICRTLKEDERFKGRYADISSEALRHRVRAFK